MADGISTAVEIKWDFLGNKIAKVFENKWDLLGSGVVNVVSVVCRESV